MTKQELIGTLKSLQAIDYTEKDPDEQKRLLHNLQVHQLELEMQNRELQETQQELEASRDRYADLYDFAPIGYATFDENGSIQEINLTGATLLGRERSRLIGLPFSKFLVKSDMKSFRDHLLQCKKNSQEVATELGMVVKGGGTLQVQLLSRAIRDEKRQVTQYRSAITDITERTQMHNEMERAQRLESAGRVAGEIAHDFNNLLSPLVAYPILIKEELSVDHPALGWLEKMETCANKIAEINQQLLALGRRGHYNMEPLDLNLLAQKVILEEKLPNSITITTQLAPDLFLIKGGTAQLTRAFINLIHNAEEAMPRGGVITIKVENVYLDKPIKGYKTIERGEYVRLEISDTGTGIDARILDKIFDPFFTAKKMDRWRGSGLGLSVVYGIIADHKGYITVESVKNQGTTFSLYLPITRELQSKITETLVLKGGSENIIVVDDDPVQRGVISQILNRLGYEVGVVANGEQAVSFVKKHRQHLLILDMEMDGIDGTETYRQILEFQPQQKAIVLSGYAMSERVQEALRFGAGTFVMKPVSPNILATVVRKELDAKRKKRP
jgi:PAS domain S-box-containing protein